MEIDFLIRDGNKQIPIEVKLGENKSINKAVPVLPIKGIAEGRLEKCKNTINSLRSLLYPNVAFETVSNKLDGINYILIIVRRQTEGTFMVSEKAERDKKINLKPGRYVRIEAETRLARVDEEYLSSAAKSLN
jgi:predicted HTH transcriptional regulator